MSTSQTSVPRKNNVATQEKTTKRRDTTRKSVTTRESASNKLLATDSKKETEKSFITATTKSKRNSSNTLMKRDSVESPRVASIKPKVTTNGSSVKPKLKKQSSSEEKRGISTIYMPKKSVSSSKGHTESNRNDVNKFTIESKASTSSKSVNRPRMPSKERRKSRTLSPSEVKMLNNKILQNSNQSTSVAKSNKKLESNKVPSDYEYEDDFEDYESDFQECTDTEVSEVSDESDKDTGLVDIEPVELQAQKIAENPIDNPVLRKFSDDEHMLDSGHYELQEARRRAARIDLMSATRHSTKLSRQVLERPIVYSDEKPSETKSLTSSVDEGFEDGRSGDFAKSPPLPVAVTYDTGDLKHHDKKTLAIPQIKIQSRLSRGQRLMQMIKLDQVEWSLYECTPIAYEEFIQIHGRINTRQISTQTNEDHLSIEIQTDEIQQNNMWTQFPVACRSVIKTKADINQYTRELKGVGGDVDDENYSPDRPQYDILQLNEFLNAAGKVILALLEGKQSQRMNDGVKSENIQQMPFSDSSIKLSVASVSFLSGRPVTMIRYSDISCKILLTIHEPADDDVQTNNNQYITDCCIGCQWNICQPTTPMRLFYSFNNITACAFHPTNYNIIFAGLEDGSLSLWDLTEDESHHKRVKDQENKVEWVIRMATYNSGGNFEDNDVFSKIVALTVLSKIEADPMEAIGKFMPIQICSLHEDGHCVVWSVLRNFDGVTNSSHDLGQSWWGKLRLVKSHEISVQFTRDKDKEQFVHGFNDINVDSVNTNSLYIATNSSGILHATRIGRRSKPLLFNGGDAIGGCTCIENSPFHQSYFFVGCEDGNVRLHSATMEKPLLSLKNHENSAAIKMIQWSRSMPLTIFVLDQDSKIHIWDFMKSHVKPVCSISPDKYVHIGSMQLSPCRTDSDLINQYIALGLDNGNVEVHKFNQQFHYSTREQTLDELNIFLNYLSI